VKSTVVEPAIVKSIPTESTKSAPVDPSHRVKTAAVKSTAAAVETPAAAMRAGVGEKRTDVSRAGSRARGLLGHYNLTVSVCCRFAEDSAAVHHRLYL
jgi:hypothetical protein